jgi:GTP-binding protein
MEKPRTKTKNPYPYSIGFKDEIVISVKAGNGGDGCVSFLREKFQPKGGPAGGDGGKGGDVIIKTSPHLNTLYHLTHSPRYHAQSGEPGGGTNCSGKNGRDIVLEVPPGTIIRDATHNNILKDLKETNESTVIAKGGHGGRGNQNYATSTNQSPRFAQPGEQGEERKLHLELKLIADVGLVGLPNAGKSLLIRKLSAAHPKVADYPFTTLEPCLGILKGSEYRTLVLADLPGLIEGAHAGKGLGDRFLKHIERTKILAHIIDFSSETSPVKSYKVIRKELSLYNPMIAKKPEIIVANKMDMPDAVKNYKKYASKFKTKPIPISALAQTGLDELAKALFKKLR